jgi:hypothetical protein
MINDVTSRMWAIYDETGIFVALCRHGFFILAADMYLSGELYALPLLSLALADTLLQGKIPPFDCREAPKASR